MNPQDHIEELLKIAPNSPCTRDKRVAGIYRDGQRIGVGWNSPIGGACSDDVCHAPISMSKLPRTLNGTYQSVIRSCGGHVEHAEAMAMRVAIETCTEDATHWTSGARYQSPILRRCELIHLNTAETEVQVLENWPHEHSIFAPKPSRRRGCPSCAVLASGFGVDAIWLLHEDGWQRWSMAEYAKLAGVE